jgi:hypothetical protein
VAGKKTSSWLVIVLVMGNFHVSRIPETWKHQPAICLGVRSRMMVLNSVHFEP